LSNRYLLQRIPPLVCVSVKPGHVKLSLDDIRVVEIDDVPHKDEDGEEITGNIPLYLVPLAVTLANGVHLRAACVDRNSLVNEFHGDEGNQMHWDWIM
jgi:hypothetical protein